MEPDGKALPPKILNITNHDGTTYIRKVMARLVSWRCQWCGREHQEWRYPSPTPKYCEECRQPALNAIQAKIMRRRRQAAKKPTFADTALPSAAPGVLEPVPGPP